MEFVAIDALLRPLFDVIETDLPAEMCRHIWCSSALKADQITTPFQAFEYVRGLYVMTMSSMMHVAELEGLYSRLQELSCLDAAVQLPTRDERKAADAYKALIDSDEIERALSIVKEAYAKLRSLPVPCGVMQEALIMRVSEALAAPDAEADAMDLVQSVLRHLPINAALRSSQDPRVMASVKEVLRARYRKQATDYLDKVTYHLRYADSVQTAIEVLGTKDADAKPSYDVKDAMPVLKLLPKPVAVDVLRAHKDLLAYRETRKPLELLLDALASMHELKTHSSNE